MPDHQMYTFAVVVANNYIKGELPDMSEDDKSSTFQAVRENLEGMNWEEYTVKALYKVCDELIADYIENLEDLDEGHIRDYPLTD